MKPDVALSSWRQWACDLQSPPVVIRQFAHGRTNRSFLLDADGYKIVMRINAPVDTLPGVDRAREALVCQAVDEAGLGPPILYIDENHRFLVTEYIDGESLDRSDLDKSLIDQLVGLLAATHGLDIDLPTFDYAEYIEKCWQIIDAGRVVNDKALLAERRKMHALATELSAAADIGVCHHDPVKSNFVFCADRLYLLDWEYAARGFIAMDYAALSVEWELDAAEILSRVSLEPAVLDKAKTLYLYLCRLWEARCRCTVS